MDYNYESMTIEELEALIAQINAERVALKVRAMAVHAVLDAKNVELSLDRKLAKISDAEMAALEQRIQVRAMASNGAVGEVTI